MSAPKLFLYKAAAANIVAILRRGHRNEWELIRWDLDTDTFTRGQWLRRKSMTGSQAAISPNGVYFGYRYDIFSHADESCHGVISRLPYFSAIFFNEQFPGRWDSVRFGLDGSALIAHNKDWIQRVDDPGLAVGGVAETAAVVAANKARDIARASKSRSKAAKATLQACEVAVIAAVADREALEAPSGFIAMASWTDSRGRLICAEGGQIWIDGVIALDTTEDVFVEVVSGGY